MFIDWLRYVVFTIFDTVLFDIEWSKYLISILENIHYRLEFMVEFVIEILIIIFVDDFLASFNFGNPVWTCEHVNNIEITAIFFIVTKFFGMLQLWHTILNDT